MQNVLGFWKFVKSLEEKFRWWKFGRDDAISPSAVNESFDAYLEQAEQLFIQTNNEEKLKSLCLEKGLIEFTFGNHVQCSKLLDKSIPILKIRGERKKLLTAYGYKYLSSFIRRLKLPNGRSAYTNE